MSGILKDNEERSKEEEITKMLIEVVKDEIGEEYDLDKLEDCITEIFKKLKKEVSKKVIEEKDERKRDCKCGRKMEIKEKVRRKVQGLVRYEFSRRSFHCPSCGIYEKPLDKIINCSGQFTTGIKEAMVLLGQRIPFEEASYFMEKLLGIKISHETIQTITEETGKKIYEDEKKEIEKQIDSDGHIKKELYVHKEGTISGTVYMQVDGSMVQTREEGWKEVRNGIIFAAEDNMRIDKHHKKIFKKKYFTIFNADKNSLELFKNRTTQIAHEYKFHQYVRQVIIGDGAGWIWDYAATYHPNAIQILDYYHASEYLGDAFQSIVFKNNKEQRKWNKKLFDWLIEGKIKKIMDWLKQQKQTEEIEKCLRYYGNNINRMNYGEYQKKGLDIGSGAVESAHRSIVQTRMKQSGMHWGKVNVQSMVSLRAKYLSGEWNDIVKDYLKAA